MTFYFRAWLKDGAVDTLNTCDLPITHDVVDGCGCQTKVSGEVKGALVPAGDLHKVASWDGESISFDGYEIEAQEIDTEWTPPPGPTLEELRERATLSRMAFMLALDDMGELDAVQAASLPNRARIMFDNAQLFERMHPEILSLASEMGYSDAQLDALFGIDEVEE